MVSTDAAAEINHFFLKQPAAFHAEELMAQAGTDVMVCNDQPECRPDQTVIRPRGRSPSVQIQSPDK
jgi:hypothetical protein